MNSPARKRALPPAPACLILLLALFGSSPACRVADRREASSPDAGVAAKSLDRIAERYVKLVLALGEHDPDYVDAYYGPARWREEAKASRQSLAEIRQAARPLAGELQRLDLSGAEEIADHPYP